jgi:response regulator of citrate/malate metabolism
MSRLRKWPIQRLTRLVQLWNDTSLTLDDIAQELGVSVGTVKRRAAYLALRDRRTVHNQTSRRSAAAITSQSTPVGRGAIAWSRWL